MLTWAQHIYFQESSLKRTDQFYISDDWNSCSWVCFCWCTAIMLMHVLCIFFGQFGMPDMHIFKVWCIMYIYICTENVEQQSKHVLVLQKLLIQIFTQALPRPGWSAGFLLLYMCTNIKGLLSWPATNMNKSGIKLAGLQSSHCACALLCLNCPPPLPPFSTAEST